MTSKEPLSLPQAIGDQLRRLRLDRFDLRQEDIAARARGLGLDWTQSTIAAIESGSRGLSLEEFFSLPLIYHPLQLADLFADDFEVEAHLRDGAVWTAPSAAFRDMLVGQFTSEDPFEDVRLQRWGTAQVSARTSISADATVVVPAPAEARAEALQPKVDAGSTEEPAEPPSKVTVRKVVKLGQVVEEESPRRIVPLVGTASAAASASGDLTVEGASDRKVELSESAMAADMLTVEVQPPRVVNLGPDAARAFRDLPPNIQERLPEIADAARSEAERKAARKFGVSPDLVSVVAFKRYHCSLSEERDNKVLEMQAQDQAQGRGTDSRTIQALRGHATRKILAEMEGLIRHYALIHPG